MEQRTGRVVVLVDYDNFEICIRRDLQMVADLAPVVRFSQTLGQVVAARAYGSWDDPQLRMAVYRTGIEPAFAPVFPTSGFQAGEGKSVADTALVSDGIDLMYLLRPEVMVVVSSDKDLMPLVRLARIRGVQVVVVGSDYTAQQLASAADRVVTYRELVGGPSRRGEPMPQSTQPAAPVTRRTTSRSSSVVATQPSTLAPSAPSAPTRRSAAQVAPVESPEAPAPDSDGDESSSDPRRRRRRRRRGKSEDGDLVEAVDIAQTEDTLPTEPVAEEAAPAPRLPFRRADAPYSRRGSDPAPRIPTRFGAPEEAVEDVETLVVDTDPIEPDLVVPVHDVDAIEEAPLAEDAVEAVTGDIVAAGDEPESVEDDAPTEPLRPASAIGPIRVMEQPRPAIGYEETRIERSEEDEEPSSIVRPPLESILGPVRSSTASDAPAVAEEVLPTEAVEGAAPEATAAPEAPARRRRRKPAEAPAPVIVDAQDEAPAGTVVPAAEPVVVDAQDEAPAAPVEPAPEVQTPEEVAALAASDEMNSEFSGGVVASEAPAETKPAPRRRRSRKAAETSAEPPAGDA